MERPKTAIGLCIALLLIVSCAERSAGSTRGPALRPPVSPGAQDPATASRIHDILQSMHVHAFNPQAPPAKGASHPGGLFINWRGTWNGDLSTAAANTNVETNGASDADAGANPRHDPLTDLVYLRNLYAYGARRPGDNEYAQDLARMEPIVNAEYAQSSYYRCWVYFQLRDLDRLGPGRGWGAIAINFADGVYRRFYDRQGGTVVDSSTSTYRTDLAAECGAMLVDAGHRQGRAEWTSAGESTLSHLIRRAQNPTTHLFPLQMRLGQQQDSVVQALMKMGEEAQLLDSFLDAYDVTADRDYLNAAVQATESLYDPAIGLWDRTNGGFFFSVDADGRGLQTAYKETRQAWMLPLLGHLARVDGGGQWTSRERTMTGIVRDHLWQASISGYPYRETPAFAIYQSSAAHGHSAVAENFASSEAMGIACQGLDDSE